MCLRADTTGTQKTNPTSESKRKIQKKAKCSAVAATGVDVSVDTLWASGGWLSVASLPSTYWPVTVVCVPPCDVACVCVRLWLPVGCARVTAPSGMNSGVTSGYNHCVAVFDLSL